MLAYATTYNAVLLSLKTFLFHIIFKLNNEATIELFVGFEGNDNVEGLERCWWVDRSKMKFMQSL